MARRRGSARSSRRPVRGRPARRFRTKTSQTLVYQFRAPSPRKALSFRRNVRIGPGTLGGSTKRRSKPRRKPVLVRRTPGGLRAARSARLKSVLPAGQWKSQRAFEWMNINRNITRNNWSRMRVLGKRCIARPNSRNAGRERQRLKRLGVGAASKRERNENFVLWC